MPNEFTLRYQAPPEVPQVNCITRPGPPTIQPGYFYHAPLSPWWGLYPPYWMTPWHYWPAYPPPYYGQIVTTCATITETK